MNGSRQRKGTLRQIRNRIKSKGWVLVFQGFSGYWIMPAGFQDTHASDEVLAILGIRPGIIYDEDFIHIRTLEILVASAEGEEVNVITPSGESVSFALKDFLEALRTLPDIKQEAEKRHNMLHTILEQQATDG